MIHNHHGNLIEPGKIVREESFREISWKRVVKPVILRKIIGRSAKL